MIPQNGAKNLLPTARGGGVNLNRDGHGVLGSLGELAMPPVPEQVAFQLPPDTSQVQQVADGFVLVTKDLLNPAHAAGLALQVWAFNSCEQMLEMSALGLDPMMTDRPRLLQGLLEQPASARAWD